MTQAITVKPSASMRINTWDYLREYDELREEILAAADRIFRSGRLVMGEAGLAFEREMAAAVGVTGGVGVNSGTDAISIALAACGVKAGDEVITVPNSAVPTAAAIRTLGARPVFVDVRDEDCLMDTRLVEAAITPRTRAILPVHLYGQCVDMDTLAVIAKKHGLKVVEDCAQGQGALYKGRQAGGLGDAAAFSFYPTKILGAYGDGGMVVSNDADVLKLARSLRFYGMETLYYSERHGYNSRLDEVQAAILSLKLPRVSGWIDRRRAIAARYDAGLAGAGLKLPRENAHSRHNYYLYVAEHPTNRDGLLDRLARCGVNCNVSYRWPIHIMRGFADLGYREGDFPVAEAKAKSVFSLPMYPQLTDAEVDVVISAVRSAV